MQRNDLDQIESNKIKPSINNNFDDSSVAELSKFIRYLSENFQTEPNLSIAIEVLECLMFIKLNHQWIGAFQFDKLDEPAGHWRWITDEPFVYTNWGMFEPNESGVEDWAAFGTDDTGTWQDWKFFGDPPPNRPRGYFVEYNPPFEQTPVIPEPSSLLLLGTGLGLISWEKRKREFRGHET